MRTYDDPVGNTTAIAYGTPHFEAPGRSHFLPICNAVAVVCQRITSTVMTVSPNFKNHSTARDARVNRGCKDLPEALYLSTVQLLK